MASSSGAPKEWSVMRRESNRNCSRMTRLQSSTRVIKTLRVVDICVKTQSRIPTIDEKTTKNTLSSTTSVKYWRQYLLQKGKSKLSLPNVPTLPPNNVVALIKLPPRKNNRAGRGKDCFAFRRIPHLTEMS